MKKVDAELARQLNYQNKNFRCPFPPTVDWSEMPMDKEFVRIFYRQ
jgi:hypothetical protein